MITSFGVDLAPAPKNDQRLFELVYCRVLRPFGLAGGRVAEVGSIVKLPRADAGSMIALRKAELA